jgi:hypothetical protein
MSRTRRISIPLAVTTLAALACSAVGMAGTISRDVTLAKAKSIVLPAVSTPTVYKVSVTGPKSETVTVDLRGKAGSIRYPGIFTTTSGSKRLRIYTYRPLSAGQYRLVLAKKSAATVKLKVSVTTKPAKKATK